MVSSATVIERDEYRVALVLPWSRQVMVIDDGASRLPRVTIPKWTRRAEELANAIERDWNVKSVVIDFLEDGSTPTPCAVVEVRHCEGKPRSNQLVSVEANKVNGTDLSDEEREVLHAISRNEAGSRGPFSRMGWLDDARMWIQSAVYDHDVEFTEDVHQLNAGGHFVLVRLGTRQGPAYWLKAVGDPNAREFNVTTNLARNYSWYLPPVVCARSDWSAWVMEEFGHALRDSPTLYDYERAVVSLAQLQVELAGKTDELTFFGCMDQRVETLSSHLDDLVEYFQEAMGNQGTTRVPRLGRARLRKLGEILKTVCSRMQDIGIPDSLIHNDVNAGNILIGDARAVFTDWCEAYVGNPFLTFGHLRAQIEQIQPVGASWSKHLCACYRRQWRERLTDAQISEAFLLMPLLAIASYLYGRGDWLRSQKRYNIRFQSYCRSLARHIDRAAQDPTLLEALCQ